MKCHLDLFSGIGGFALAVDRVWPDVDVEHIFCEIKTFPRAVLRKHWPDAPSHEDIRKLDGRQFEAIDLVTGGFPCQPYSLAGKRKGPEDDRALWSEMFRIIQEARPRWVVGENVTGFISMGLDGMLADLAGAGYETQAFVIPACAVGAPHRRDRVWIVAHSNDSGRGQLFQQEQVEWGGEKADFRRNGKIQSMADTAGAKIWGRSQKVSERESDSSQRPRKRSSDVADSEGAGLSNRGQAGRAKGKEEAGGGMALAGVERCGCSWWAVEPDVGRVTNGVPRRVDRLRALGNAIVPQVATIILRGIKEVDNPKENK